jgi:hypothetical protein
MMDATMRSASDVIATLHNDDANRAVKIIRQPDGTFGFNEYRRDPEDAGGWTLVAESSGATLTTERQALAAARASIAWFGAMVPSAVED